MIQEMTVEINTEVEVKERKKEGDFEFTLLLCPQLDPKHARILERSFDVLPCINYSTGSLDYGTNAWNVDPRHHSGPVNSYEMPVAVTGIVLLYGVRMA